MVHVVAALAAGAVVVAAGGVTAAARESLALIIESAGCLARGDGVADLFLDGVAVVAALVLDLELGPAVLLVEPDRPRGAGLAPEAASLAGGNERLVLEVVAEVEAAVLRRAQEHKQRQHCSE